MARQQGPACQNHMIAQQDIVSDMAVLHQKIVGADNCLLGDFVGTMHGNVLAKDIVISNAHPSRFIAILQILRRFSDDAASKELVSAADYGLAREINMRANDALRADLDSFINNRIRADRD
jgi:hypothetical protein